MAKKIVLLHIKIDILLILSICLFYQKENLKLQILFVIEKNKRSGVKISGTLQQTNNGVLVAINGKDKRLVKEFGARYNIWDIPAEKNNKTGHPAVFPLRLAQDHIISWSNEGDTVLDCFMGSGTTGVAAKNLNRDFIGIDLDDKYFRIAKDRIEQAQKFIDTEYKKPTASTNKKLF